MRAATIGVILLVFAATGNYLTVSVSESVNAGMVQQTAAMLPMHSTDAGKSLTAVEHMVQKLEQRLEGEPENDSGWDLPGRSYEFPGRARDADAVLTRAVGLGYQGPVTAQPDPVSVRFVLRLDPSLADNVTGSETVFIIDRAISGPRAPLAVLRKSVNELPVEFVLDDSVAIMSELKLSGVGEHIVEVVISASGKASASAGDLEGYSSVVDVNSPINHAIRIDQAALPQATV